jgi:hypothetical protein
VIAHFGAGFPDAGETSLDQQVQNVPRVWTVGLLLANIAGRHLTRITDPHFMAQLFE